MVTIEKGQGYKTSKCCAEDKILAGPWRRARAPFAKPHHRFPQAHISA